MKSPLVPDEPASWPDLESAVTALLLTHARFQAAQISPLEHSRLREASLGSAVVAVAAVLGVNLRQPLRLDSRADFHLKAEPKEPWPGSPDICGHFGEEFAALLNRHQARCGVAPGHMQPESGWCYLNHFAAEAMVMEYAEQALADKLPSIRQFIGRTVRAGPSAEEALEESVPGHIDRAR